MALRLVARKVEQYGYQPGEVWSLWAKVAWTPGTNPTDDDILDTAQAVGYHYWGPGRSFASEPCVQRKGGNTAVVYQRGGLDI